MIVFDRRTRRILRRIYWCDKAGITWSELALLYGDDAGLFLLEAMTLERYIITKCGDQIVTEFRSENVYNPDCLRAFITPKGRELVERVSFDFWKFVIPLLISFASLIISLQALLSKI